jgi:hypothetical protein
MVLPLPGLHTRTEDSFTLANAGVLTIELNHNSKGTAAQIIEDLPPRLLVEVRFPDGDYTAYDVAQRIHTALQIYSAGQAAAYPDGKVVVETAVPGLAGSVTLPAPGTGTAGGDQALIQQLLGDTVAVQGRGWPGVGFDSPLGDPLRTGYRSKKLESAQVDATWEFEFKDTKTKTTATAKIKIKRGQAIQEIQGAVDDALRQPKGAPNRIGLCVMGPDGTLLVESTDPKQPLTLKVIVDGRTLGIIDPGQNEPGKTPEREQEPALGLRCTHEIRTFRYARDRVGDGDPTQVDDLGWIRLPAHMGHWLVSTSANITEKAGAPAMNLRLPPGRYFTAARADAAKTRDYDSTGDMIASVGTDPHNGTQHFMHQARYWMQFDDAELLGITRIIRGTEADEGIDYLVDFLWKG